MKKITLLLTLLLSFCINAQISIGEGTNQTQGTPFDPYFGYSYSQSIYLASEVNANGNITALQWYYSGISDLSNNQDIKIYLGHTSKTVFTSTTDWVTLAGLTQVYAGGIVVSGPGWVTLTFDTPFPYNGTDNLVIAVDENRDGYNVSDDDFYNSSVSGNRSIFYRSDSINPDPAAPVEGTLQAFIPTLKLEGIAPACLNPTNLSVSNITTESVQIQWADPSGTLTDFEFVVQEAGTGEPTGSGISVEGLSTTYNQILPSTAYELYVRTNCGDDVFSTWVGPVTFFSACVPFSVPYFEGFETGYSNATTLSGCFSQESIAGDDSNWVANNTAVDYNRTPRTGNWNSNLRYGNEDWLFIPLQLVGGTAYQLEFFARQDGATPANASVKVSYGIDDNAAAMLTPIVSETGLINGDYQQFIGFFTPETDGVYYVGIYGKMNFSPWYISLDDISIGVAPACPAPTSVAANNITSNSAVLTWNGVSDNYEYVLNNSATTPTEGTLISETTYEADSLDGETTYYFHIRSECESEWVTLSFTTLPNPPSNNECVDATSLEVGSFFEDNVVASTTAAATNNSSNPVPDCGALNFATTGKDVWFSVVVPDTGSVIVETQLNDGLTDTAMEAFSGACNDLTLISCNDDVQIGVLNSRLTLSDLTPGETILVRVWGYNGSQGTFEVSAYDESLSAPSFDDASFAFYPNPVKDVLNLSYISSISSISVINLLGQEMITKNINANQSEVDLSTLSAGTYLIKVTTEDNLEKTIKIVKQ